MNCSYASHGAFLVVCFICQALEKKIIVGGVNLLEKAEEQQRLLEESAQELEQQHEKEAKLKEALGMYPVL